MTSALAGTTRLSAVPCHTDNVGHGPSWSEALAILLASERRDGIPCPRIRSRACGTPSATANGSPAMIAPPANNSGCVASMTAAIAPPADSPLT